MRRSGFVMGNMLVDSTWYLYDGDPRACPPPARPSEESHAISPAPGRSHSEWTTSPINSSEPKPFQAQALKARAAEIAVQEAERKRIARDLHDDIGHRITAAILRIDIAAEQCAGLPTARRELEIVRELMVESSDCLHDVAFTLRPQILDDLGLLPALRGLAHRVQAATGIDVEFWSSDAQPNLTSVAELAAFRIAQEALTNAFKHAAPGRVSIAVESSADNLTLTICDDGRGFDPESVDLSGGAHFGLAGMRERAESAGGRLLVQSSRGYGTIISAWFPVGEEQS
jgi:signal transduction histidine kinase